MVAHEARVQARKPSLNWQSIRANHVGGSTFSSVPPHFPPDLKSDGKAYVGSAYGDGNLLGRWLTYAASGHGGNSLLKRDPKNFQFTILQRVSPDMEADEVIKLESTWKERLHTRQPFGLTELDHFAPFQRRNPLPGFRELCRSVKLNDFCHRFIFQFAFCPMM
jgi:hypothetical protein